MALGDGIRRDVATVSPEERKLLLDAFIQLDTTKFYPDSVSYWDKQEDIHKNAHFAGLDVHEGLAFIPWHRVLVNRLEELLREIHPEISLHYWDWTTDPRAASVGRAALFTNTFMGGTGNPAGPPFKDFESTEKSDTFEGDGIHDHIWRQVGRPVVNGLLITKADGTPNLEDDDTIIFRSTIPLSFCCTRTWIDSGRAGRRILCTRIASTRALPTGWRSLPLLLLIPSLSMLNPGQEERDWSPGHQM